MKCRHCLVEFHAQEGTFPLGRDVDKEWKVSRFDCPACLRMNLWLVNFDYETTSLGKRSKTITSFPIRPQGSSRPPCPLEVPPDIAEDYNEACAVLSFSLKASAALSRRCLQSLLRQAAKVKHGELHKEIQEVIDSGKLPPSLAEVVDVVRNIGNFATHPIKSKNTGEILAVEQGEAEWNLDVLEALFDFYYVQPARIAQKRDALNKKLNEAGKPPIKTP